MRTHAAIADCSTDCKHMRAADIPAPQHASGGDAAAFLVEQDLLDVEAVGAAVIAIIAIEPDEGAP